MLTKTILAASALMSMATAVPMQQDKKREVVWETSTAWDVTTIDVTTTVWLAPGETAPAGAGAAHHGHHHKHKVTSHIKSTVTVQPASSSPPEQSPSSPYVAPTPSSPAAPETSTWAAPTSQSPPPAPKPSPTKTGGSTGTSPNGATYTGDITHYDVGLGSCGWTNDDSEAVVAIPFGMMNNGVNPNDNPLCGKMITISYGGSTHTAKVVDTCGGCYGAAIDLSPTLFTAVAPNGNGRVHGVEWWFN